MGLLEQVVRNSRRAGCFHSGDSFSGLLLTTECMVTEIPEKKEAPMPGGHGGGMGDMGM